MLATLTAASWESLLVMVAVMVISAASNWVKKRQEQAEAEKHRLDGPPLKPTPLPNRTPRPPGAPPRPAPMTDWETELRRLLDGNSPTEGPTPPPRTTPQPTAPVLDPAPTVVVVRPSPIRPVVISRGAPAQEAPVASGTLEESVAIPPHNSPVRFPSARPSLENAPAPDFQLASMAESQSAINRGLAVDNMAAARLATAVSLTEQAKPMTLLRRETVSPALKAMADQLSRRDDVRRAFLASIVLGPPKALASDPIRTWT